MANFIRRRFFQVLKAKQRFLLIFSISVVEIFLNIGRRARGDSLLCEGYSLFLLGRHASGPAILYYNHRSMMVWRPVVPILASPLILISDNVNLSYGLVSGFFWIGGAVIVYKLGQLILKDKDLATIVALSYVTAPVLLMWGAAVLTDSAGFFFIGLIIYLTLKREQQEQVSSRTYFSDALIASIGVLVRESVLLALLFMVLRRFMKRKGFKETLFATILVGIFGLLFLSLLEFSPDMVINNYLRVTEYHKMTPNVEWGLLPYLYSLGRAFVTNIDVPSPYFVSLSFWIWTLPFLFWGICTLVGLLSGLRNKALIICLLVLFPSSVIAPAMGARHFFCMWPVTIPAMVSGMNLILSKLSFIRQRIPHGSKTCLLLYICVLGVLNTFATLANYGSLTVAHQ